MSATLIALIFGVAGIIFFGAWAYVGFRILAWIFAPLFGRKRSKIVIGNCDVWDVTLNPRYRNHPHNVWNTKRD